MAREQYAAAREIAPDDAEILNNLGLTLAQLGETDAARQRFEEAGAADPEWAVPFFHLGDLFSDQEAFADAEAAYSEALVRNPQFDRAQFNRGTVRYQRGEFQGAFEDFLAVYQARPEDTDALYNLGAAAVAAAEDAQSAQPTDNATTGEQNNAQTQGE